MCLARIVAGCAIVAAIAMFGSHGLTQEKKGGADKAKAKLPIGYDKLNLTPEQADMVLKLQADQKAAVDKLKQQIAVLDAQLVKDRLNVLTDEQRKK